MLDDTSRKVLRILFNSRRAPSVSELARLSGRRPKQVEISLRKLNKEQFIQWEWERGGELKIIRPWEEDPFPKEEMFRWWEYD